MQGHQLPHQRQADAHSALHPVGRGRALKEGFKNTMQEISLHTGAWIADGHHRLACLCGYKHLDLAGWGRKLQGIGKQIVDDLFNPRPVGVDPGRRAEKLNAIALCTVCGAQRFHTTGHTVGQVQRAFFELDLARHQTAHVQQVVDDMRQVPVLPLNNVQVTLCAIWVRTGGFQQCCCA